MAVLVTLKILRTGDILGDEALMMSLAWDRGCSGLWSFFVEVGVEHGSSTPGGFYHLCGLSIRFLGCR
jgi:hypothetical protein